MIHHEKGFTSLLYTVSKVTPSFLSTSSMLLSLKWLFSFLSFLFVAFAAHAGLKISPAYLDLGEVQPGQKINVKLNITNTGGRSEFVKIRMGDPTKDEEENWQHDSKSTGKRSLKRWVKFKAGSFELKPLKEVEKTVSIQVPKSAYGDYRAMLLVEQSHAETLSRMKDDLAKKRIDNPIPDDEVTQTVFALSRIAIPLHSRVVSNRTRTNMNSALKGKINLKISKKTLSLDTKHPTIDFPMMLENNSEFRIAAAGQCQILSPNNQVILSQEFNSLETFSFEKTRFHCRFPNYLPAGAYKLNAILTSNIYKSPLILPLKQNTAFKLTAKESAKLSRFYMKSNSKKLMTPLAVSPRMLESQTNKPFIITLKNVTDQDQIVRPFFLEMPKGEMNKKAIFEPPKFRVKAFSSKEVKVKIRPKYKKLAGKLIFSVQQHKEKLPISMNLIMNLTDSRTLEKDLTFPMPPHIKDYDKTLYFHSNVKNSGTGVIRDLEYWLELNTPEGKSVLRQQSFFSKPMLLPGESTVIKFAIKQPLKVGGYMGKIVLKRKMKVMKSQPLTIRVAKQKDKTTYSIVP